MAARFTPPSPGKVIALDLETLRKAHDWSEADKRDMGIACCGVEDVDSGQTAAFVDANVVSKIARNCGNLADLQAALNKTAVIVTFGGGNLTDKGFDFCVIEGTGLTVDRSRSFDIRLEVKSRCAQQGITPSGSITLGSLAQANACPEYPSLGQGKTGAGADAPERWAAGEHEAVIDYCLDDVKMTADLYRLWTSRGYLFLPDGQRVGFTNEEIYATDATSNCPTVRRGGNPGSGVDRSERVPAPQSAGAGDAAGASVGDGEQVGRHAAVRDRLTAPAFDSANFPVQDRASLSAEPVQAETSLPVENKALPAQPVQVGLAACPKLESWRQFEGIWLPRYFTAVPHLKYERTSLSSNFKPVTEIKTGWQIQWNTACPVCEKRFRPVAGFITILHVERMKEMSDDDQQAFVGKIIRDKFASGVSGQHPKCAG